jgi:hypothetical protein
MWSKVKNFLRSVEARTQAALIEASGLALQTVTAQDAMNCFASCGYSIYLKCSNLKLCVSFLLACGHQIMIHGNDTIRIGKAGCKFCRGMATACQMFTTAPDRQNE